MSKKLIENKKYGIIDSVTILMTTVELFVEKSGEEKKQYVIEQMKILLDDTEYQLYSEIIENLIEFIIAISKNKYDLKLNKITKCCIII